jgi:lysozyme
MSDVCYGIDVSNNNGVFDWDRWQGHIQFAMAKATETDDFQDAQFERNWDAMRKLGIKRLAYHYAEPAVSPARQARFFLNTVSKYGINRDDNFVLDLEQTDGMSPVDVSFWAWTFCHTVNTLRPHHRTIVYTYPSFADAGNCAQLGGHPLWVANYGVPAPEVPPPWRTWRFWQYVGTPLGLDKFNGSKAELDKFLGN